MATGVLPFDIYVPPHSQAVVVFTNLDKYLLLVKTRKIAEMFRKYEQFNKSFKYQLNCELLSFV